MRRTFGLWVLALVLAFVACLGSSGTSGTAADAGDDDASLDAPASSDVIIGAPSCIRVPEAGACGRWPADAETYDDASGKGCHVFPVSLVCAVPNGSVVNADGAAFYMDGAPAPEDCCDECALTEYAIYCGLEGKPDPALGCHAPRSPTPGLNPSCCPCSQ